MSFLTSFVTKKYIDNFNNKWELMIFLIFLTREKNQEFNSVSWYLIGTEEFVYFYIVIIIVLIVYDVMIYCWISLFYVLILGSIIYKYILKL